MKLVWQVSALLMLYITGCNPNHIPPDSPSPLDSSQGTTSEPKDKKTSDTLPNRAEEKIRQQAQKITVLIEGKGKGSGLIINRNGDTYYVLTSKHVVGIEPSRNIKILNPQPHEINLAKKEDPYQVRTHDGKIYTVDYGKVKKDPNLDLAIIEFTSKSEYSIAKLATSVSKDQSVYMYGLKDCFSATRDKKEEFNSGKISSLIEPKNSDGDEGYNVNYTNPTITGMSGSPVFDQPGRVVAIHGKPGKKDKEKDYSFDKCLKLEDNFGNNWGISMKTFVSSKIASEMQLKADETPIKDTSSPSQPKDNTPPNNPSETIPKFKRSKS